MTYRITLWLIVLFVLMAWSFQTEARQRSYQNGQGDVLVLSDKPCVSMKGMLGTVPINQRRPGLKAAKYLWKGKYYDACWIVRADGATAVVDETGDAGIIEGSPFDPPKRSGGT